MHQLSSRQCHRRALIFYQYSQVNSARVHPLSYCRPCCRIFPACCEIGNQSRMKLGGTTYRLCRCFASILVQVTIGHDLSADEFIFKVRAEQIVNAASQRSPVSCTHWMTPAACGALVPFLMVHARTSSGPQVKYRISWFTIRPFDLAVDNGHDRSHLQT